MTIEFLRVEEALSADLPFPDIYYSPAYGRSAELVDDGTWECAVGDSGRFVYPYIRRELPPALVGRVSGEYDIVSPYGYAGVAMDSPNLDNLAAFRREFFRLSRERGLIAEFVRTNPFDVDEMVLSALGAQEYKAHSTYAIQVGQDTADYWPHAEGRHRTAVRKAESLGIEVSVRDARIICDSAGSFRRIYAMTMNRVGASRRLSLGDDYFHRLSDALGAHVMVLEAALDGEVCASTIFLEWRGRLHYHLSGSTPAGMRAGATNAILDAAVRRLLPPFGVLHLGGGITPGDGLQQFKKSASTRECVVYFCSTIVAKERYAQLAGMANSSEAYFPAYRAPQ